MGKWNNHGSNAEVYYPQSGEPEAEAEEEAHGSNAEVYHSHGVCSAPAEQFNLDQIGCPSDRTDSCVAGNRDYVNFEEAWAACGRIPECGVIMRWTSGNYYLRRRSDPMVAVA